MALATLLAVVARFGLTLASLTRQRVALASLAWSDALTGLTNHRRFHELLSQAVAAARASESPLSVVTLDVDHFKAVNDTYGHAAGDEALKAIAAELGHQLRGADVVDGHGKGGCRCGSEGSHGRCARPSGAQGKHRLCA